VRNKQPSPLQDKRERYCIAIPCYGEEVAPCFSASCRFRFWYIENRQAVDYREEMVETADWISRVRLIRALDARVILCNGIEVSTRRMLEAEGRRVIDGVMGTTTDALFGFLAGRFQYVALDENDLRAVQPHAADTVEWTRELFEAHDWKIRQVVEPESFPVDLIGEKQCPICGKPVWAAICCGAHAYRVDEEIREFKRNTATGYNARVYVHQAFPAIVQACREYEIELIDPSKFIDSMSSTSTGSVLAPLTEKVQGHKKVNTTWSNLRGT